MFNKQIKQDIKEIKEVLEIKDINFVYGGKPTYISKNIEEKVSHEYFNEFKENVIGNDLFESKTINQRLEQLETTINNLEKYLGIQYTEEMVEGYKKIKKSK